MQDGLITATPEWMRQLSTQEQKEYFNYCYQFIDDRYGRENIISAVVHLDEANPHMYFVFVPITKDNRLSSKDVMGGPKGMKKLQDDFYDYMRKQGVISPVVVRPKDDNYEIISGHRRLYKILIYFVLNKWYNIHCYAIYVFENKVVGDKGYY